MEFLLELGNRLIIAGWSLLLGISIGGVIRYMNIIAQENDDD